MGQLMNDIVSTADAFTSNFSDKGPFDYSIESLVLVDNLLEELSDYEWDEDNLYSLESMVKNTQNAVKIKRDTASQSYNGKEFLQNEL